MPPRRYTTQNMDNEKTSVEHIVDLNGLSIGFDIVHLPAGMGESGRNDVDIKFGIVTDSDEFMASYEFDERLKFYETKLDWVIENFGGDCGAVLTREI